MLSVHLPPVVMTWAKFTATVLDSAEALEILVPHDGTFIGVVTAVHADAPPILKWDRPHRRNPVSWYFYNGGSSASSWKLEPHRWYKINAIAPYPNLWGERPMPYLAEGVVLVIDGAVDTRQPGNCLFPEILIDDLHAVRSTIEAYAHSAQIAGKEEAGACGYGIGKNGARCTLRAFALGAWTSYQIDRWD